MKKLILLAVMLACVACAIVFNACNVTRVITSKSEFYQHGDTSVMIQTRVTETYDATTKVPLVR